MTEKTNKGKVPFDGKQPKGRVFYWGLIVVSALVVLIAVFWIIEEALPENDSNSIPVYSEDAGIDNIAYGAEYLGDAEEGVLYKDSTVDYADDYGTSGERDAADSTDEKGGKSEARPAGEKGEKGDAGPAGEKGEKGDAGPVGEKGEKGDAGPAGEKGDRGPAGKDGKDAVESDYGEELSALRQDMETKHEKTLAELKANKEYSETVGMAVKSLGDRLTDTTELTASHTQALAGIKEEVSGLSATLASLTKEYEIPQEDYAELYSKLEQMASLLMNLKNILDESATASNENVLLLAGDESVIALSGDTGYLLEILEELKQSLEQGKSEETELLLPKLYEALENQLNALSIAENTLIELMAIWNAEGIETPDIALMRQQLFLLQTNISAYRVNDFVTDSYLSTKLTEVYSEFAVINERINSVESRLGPLSFSYDEATGRYGYIDGTGLFCPFRNPAGTADVTKVLAGETFSNAESDKLTGTMPNMAAKDNTAVGTPNYIYETDEDLQDGDVDKVTLTVRIPIAGFYSDSSTLSVDATEIYKKGQDDYLERITEKGGDPDNHLILLKDSSKQIKGSAVISMANANCNIGEVAFNPGYRTLICLRGKNSAGALSESVNAIRFATSTLAYTDAAGKRTNIQIYSYNDAKRKNNMNLCVLDITDWEYIRLSKSAFFDNTAVTTGSTEQLFVFTTLSSETVLEKIEDYYQNW